MGWFWADAPSSPSLLPPPNHPTTGKPPESCPMHTTIIPAPPKDSACPYTPPDNTLSPTTADEPTNLNPLNLMFATLSQKPSTGQKTPLPTERETSSIPKGDSEGGNWEYPSPQQMYNAMKKKGGSEIPEDAVESMVAVHNFLNEGAWGEIVEWEKMFAGGIVRSLIIRKEQEQQQQQQGRGSATTSSSTVDEKWKEPKLLRFQGRSKELTPKAQMLQFLGRVYPSKFATPPPFDRHDWYVLRHTPGSAEPKQIRYVIDYYSGDPEPTGEPVFYLDVRPAIDRPSAILERVVRWGGDIWERASGADVRREAAAQAERERRER